MDTIAYDGCIPITTAWRVLILQMVTGPSDVDRKIKDFPRQGLKSYRGNGCQHSLFLNPGTRWR